MRLGKHEREMLLFLRNPPMIGFMGIGTDRVTQRAATSLARKGLIGAVYSVRTRRVQAIHVIGAQQVNL